MLRPIAVLLLATAGLAAARTPLAVPRQPLILRLVGHFTPDRETARAQGVDAIGIRIDGRERWFAVDGAENMNALSTPMGRDVIAAVSPFEPALVAVGDARLRRRLLDAPAGAPIELEGLVDTGPRTYLLRRVADAMPAARPAP